MSYDERAYSLQDLLERRTEDKLFLAGGITGEDLTP
jgi:hypothetical protein